MNLVTLRVIVLVLIAAVATILILTKLAGMALWVGFLPITVVLLLVFGVWYFVKARRTDN